MEINVAYGANESFSKHTYISLLSLLLHSNKKDIINCFFFTVKNNKRTTLIKNLENSFRNFKYNEIICSEDKLEGLKTSNRLKHVNIYTYCRFFISTLKWIEKLLYLDSDTIILQDVNTLYNEDINDYIVWVVSDIPNDFILQVKSELKLKGDHYFNAWVMLINLKKRNEKNISEKCLSLLSANSYPCNDQDSLNITLESNCVYLDWKYNVQTWFFEKYEKYELWFNKEYYKKAVKNPFIIHYTWCSKPRFLLDNHPYRHCYDKMVRFAIFVNLKIFRLYPIQCKDFFILCLHTIENIFPKYTAKKAREYTNYIIHKVHLSFKRV